jgi:hypothetical protein
MDDWDKPAAKSLYGVMAFTYTKPKVYISELVIRGMVCPVFL